ncbi:EscU/YscU/HrcU family type III secretion system export apparatus switch protein [Pandoraea pneumonica]|uniref:EscU/YscU/HrcU family type III secretion system export apparatus switch protein n=1 Tax=Pandoraea pneumonica TaxID=2508299 RepID=UPI003CF4BB2F
MSEKNQPPTPKKIQDERKKGRVAKSADLAVCAQLGIVLAWLVFEGPALYVACVGLVQRMLLVLGDPVGEAVRGLLVPSLMLLMRFCGGLAVVLIVCTWLVMVLQIGALVAPEAITPKYERIDPVAKAKQLFSLQSLFEFMKSLLKVGVLGTVFFYLIRQYTPSLAVLPQCGADCGFTLTARMLFWLMSALVIAYVVFGALDFAFQKYNLNKQLMMSHDEIKREYKEVDGNPEIKHKRREFHRETIESGSLANNVKRSTVVVRNPTRLAVCLRYVAGETPVPCVIEKGRNERARTIVALAEREGVPVVEHIPVARRLMADVEIDAPIPVDLFDVVASILRLALDLPYEAQGGGEPDAAGARTGEAQRPDGNGRP